MNDIDTLRHEANVYYVENYGGNLKEWSAEKEAFVNGFMTGRESRASA